MTMTMITLIRVMMRRIMIIMVSINTNWSHLSFETFAIICWDIHNYLLRQSQFFFWELLRHSQFTSWQFTQNGKVKVFVYICKSQGCIVSISPATASEGAKKKQISEAEKFRFANKQSWKVEFLMGCQLSTRQIPSDLCLHSSGKTWPSQKEFLSLQIILSSSLRVWKLLEIIHFSSLRISKPGQKKSFSSH